MPLPLWVLGVLGTGSTRRTPNHARRRLSPELLVAELEERRVLNGQGVFTELSVETMIDENGMVTLQGEFDAPDGGEDALQANSAGDGVTLVVNWGEGLPEQFDLAPGATSFEVTHQYLDDNPTGTPEDVYTIVATLLDDGSEIGEQSVMTTVTNEDPEISDLTVTPMIDEDGTVTLSGVITDVGTQDKFTLIVDWGEGLPEEFEFPTGTSDFAVMHQYLDDNPTGTLQDDYEINVTLRDDDTGEFIADPVTTTVKNVDPEISDLTVTPMIDEDGTVTLSGVIGDVGTQDKFTLIVDWGEGLPEEFEFAAGTTDFSVMHQYLDDNPTGTLQDDYEINVTLRDDDTGEFIADPVTTTVKNVDPEISDLTVTPMIDENGTVTLSGVISDVGTQDKFSLIVDWGEGLPEEFEFAAGTTDFSVMHQYLDDNPTGTLQDDYEINVTLRDDDTGEFIADPVTTTVKNVDPAISDLTVTPMIDENGTVTLSGVISDVGTQDKFTLVVDWGEGLPEEFEFAAGTTDFAVMHQYLDDNPTGTLQDDYEINVTLRDDDTGEFIADPVTTTVKNVDPEISDLAVTPMIDENGTVTLSGVISDVGTQDKFTLVVDWGEGLPEEFEFAAGTTDFAVMHQYLDDNPTGTSQDDYEIHVTLRDDDTGEFIADPVTTTVKNVDPELTNVAVTAMIDEDETVTLTGEISDVGTQDKFTLIVDWGEGLPEEFEFAAGTTDFSVTHQYLDDDPTATSFDDFTIDVTLVDDDTGMAVDQTTTRVSNVAPVATDMGNFTVEAGEPFDPRVLATFLDQGTLDTHTATIDWGDGSPIDAGMVTEPSSPGTVAGGHLYILSGTFTVTVNVVDDDTGVDTVTFDVRVIPPPPAGGPPAGPPALQLVPFSAPSNEGPGTQAAVLSAEEVGRQGLEGVNDLRSAGTDSVAAVEKRFVLREVFASGKEGEDIPLQDEVLDELPILYASLPDGEFRIYQLREDGTERLVVDVHLRNGEPFDPTDDLRGTQDQPPTEQSELPAPAGKDPKAAEADDSAMSDPMPADTAHAANGEADRFRGVETLPDSPRKFALRAALVGTGLAAYAAGGQGVETDRLARKFARRCVRRAARVARRICIDEVE